MTRRESASLSSRFTIPLNRAVEDDNLDEPKVDYGVFDIGAASLEASNVATIALNHVDGSDYGLVNSLQLINNPNDSSKSGKISGIGKLKNLFTGGKKTATPKSKESELLPDNTSITSAKVKHVSPPMDKFVQLPQSTNKHNQQNRKILEFEAFSKLDSPLSLSHPKQSTGSTDIGFVVTNLNLNQSLVEENPDPFLLEESGSSFSNPDFEIDNAFHTNPDALDPLHDFGTKENWEEPSGNSSNENLAAFFGFNSDPFQLIDNLGSESFERESTKVIPELSPSRKPLVKINSPNSLIPIPIDEHSPEKLVHESNCRNANAFFSQPLSLDFPAFVAEANHSNSPNSSTANDVLFSAISQSRNNLYDNEETAKIDASNLSGKIPGMEIQWRTKVVSHDDAMVKREHVLKDERVVREKGVTSPKQSSLVPPNPDAVKVTDEAHDGYLAERKQARSRVCQEKERVVTKGSVTPTGLVVQLASKYDSLHDHKDQLQIHKSRSSAPSTNKFFPRTSPKAIEDNFSKSPNHQESLGGKDSHNQQKIRREKTTKAISMEEVKRSHAAKSAFLTKPTAYIEKVTLSSVKQDESHTKPSNTSIHRRLTRVSSQKEQPVQLSQVKVIDKAELTHQAHQEGKHEPIEQFARTVDSSKEVPINDIPWKKSRTSNLLVSTELDLSGANTSHASSSSKIFSQVLRKL